MLRPYPRMAQPRVNFRLLLSQSQDWLKKPIFSHEVLGDNGGAIAPAQNEARTCHQGSMESHCRSTLYLICYWKRAPGWLGDLSLGRDLGRSLGRSVGCV